MITYKDQISRRNTVSFRKYCSNLEVSSGSSSNIRPREDAIICYFIFWDSYIVGIRLVYVWSLHDSFGRFNLVHQIIVSFPCLFIIINCFLGYTPFLGEGPIIFFISLSFVHCLLQCLCHCLLWWRCVYLDLL